MTSQTLPSRRSSYLAALAGLVVTVAFVMYPEAAFEASLDGLKLWFEIVLPALLPFFTMSEILMGLGVIHAVGVLLEPLMRPCVSHSRGGRLCRGHGPGIRVSSGRQNLRAHQEGRPVHPGGRRTARSRLPTQPIRFLWWARSRSACSAWPT